MDTFDLDRYLSSGPYGGSTALKSDVAHVYDGIADVIHDVLGVRPLSGTSPAARVVARAACERAFVELRNERTSHARDIVTRATRVIEQSDSSRIDARFTAIDDWSTPLTQIIAETLAASMRADGFSGGISFLVPSDDDVATIHAALSVLERLLPKTSANTLDLLSCFALIEAEFESAYNSEAPLMFMINRMMLADSLAAADTILHESLHQKMADLRVTSLFFKGPYDDRASEERGDLLLPWGRNAPRPFSIARGLATHHVYVHSAALFAAALRACDRGVRFEIDRDEIVRRFNRSMDRANFLGASLRRPHCRERLGDFANGFVDWLNHAFLELHALGCGGRAPDRFAAQGLQLV